nr:hypothetical protein [Tanacetum cinerariifolium]
MPKVLLLAWDRVFEIKNAFGNKQYKPEDVWNRPAFSNHDDDDDDDDEDYTIAITPKEPDNSQSIKDEHLNTIPAMELDEVIKSSVEDLVPIPNESEGIPDNTCDVPFRDNCPPLDVSKDQFKEFSDSNDDYTSINDDYFSIDNINYVEASPPDSKLIEPDQGELTSVVMKDNLAEPRVHVPNVLTTHPTLMLDLDFIPSDNSLPESEIFYINIKEKNNGSTTIHADISLPYLECFNFKRDPYSGKLTSIVDSGFDYTIAITPKEPDNSQSIKDEHLNTIPAMELDEVIKSSVEDLVPIPNESEGIPDNTCDVPFRDNSPPLDIEPDQGELTSVVMKDNLAEPRVYVPNVLTTHPTLMLDLDFIPFDNSLPESEIFYINIKEKNNGSTTIHADISLPYLESTNVNLPPEEDHSPLFAYVVWIFLSFLMYHVVPPYRLPSGNKDTIFDPGISNYHFPFLLPSVSHRCETFMKFNVYPKLLDESPMEILSSTCSPMD